SCKWSPLRHYGLAAARTALRSTELVGLVPARRDEAHQLANLPHRPVPSRSANSFSSPLKSCHNSTSTGSGHVRKDGSAPLRNSLRSDDAEAIWSEASDTAWPGLDPGPSIRLSPSTRERLPGQRVILLGTRPLGESLALPE